MSRVRSILNSSSLVEWVTAIAGAVGTVTAAAGNGGAALMMAFGVMVYLAWRLKQCEARHDEAEAKTDAAERKVLELAVALATLAQGDAVKAQAQAAQILTVGTALGAYPRPEGMDELGL